MTSCGFLPSLNGLGLSYNGATYNCLECRDPSLKSKYSPPPRTLINPLIATLDGRAAAVFQFNNQTYYFPGRFLNEIFSSCTSSEPGEALCQFLIADEPQIIYNSTKFPCVECQDPSVHQRLWYYSISRPSGAVVNIPMISLKETLTAYETSAAVFALNSKAYYFPGAFLKELFSRPSLTSGGLFCGERRSSVG